MRGVISVSPPRLIIPTVQLLLMNMLTWCGPVCWILPSLPSSSVWEDALSPSVFTVQKTSSP